MASPQEIASLLAAQHPEPVTPAMGALMAAREQLATQPARMPTSYGAPMADQAAMQPETFANPAVARAMGEMASLPRRAIENSQFALNTGNYDPRAPLEAAMLPMGTGAIAGVPMRGGEAVLGAGPIRAYHGSPHDFDAFSMDKIGTGEGAQAYGHGLYFADQEGTAKAYRDQLSYMNKSLNGERFYGNESPAHGMLSDAMDAGTGIDGAIAKATQTYQDFTKGPNASYRNAQTAKQALDQLQEWKSSANIAHDPGHMYEVNINADPAHFLDWDKPLAEQPPHVQSALSDIAAKIAENRSKYNLTNAADPTGAALYETRALSGGDYFDKTAASAALQARGIPGIKYLDQGSRNKAMLEVEPHEFNDGSPGFKVNGPKGDQYFDTHNEAQSYINSIAAKPSSNYVVFNDKLIDIARKYGMGSMAALPPAVLAAMGGGSSEDPQR